MGETLNVLGGGTSSEVAGGDSMDGAWCEDDTGKVEVGVLISA